MEQKEEDSVRDLEYAVNHGPSGCDLVDEKRFESKEKANTSRIPPKDPYNRKIELEVMVELHNKRVGIKIKYGEQYK